MHCGIRFITNLGRADGVHFKTAQELARHSTPMLTARYTHGFKGDEVAAVNALPNLSQPTHEALKATGTDDTAPNRLALCLAQLGGCDDTGTDSNGLKGGKKADTKIRQEQAKSRK